MSNLKVLSISALVTDMLQYCAEQQAISDVRPITSNLITRQSACLASQALRQNLWKGRQESHLSCKMLKMWPHLQSLQHYTRGASILNVTDGITLIVCSTKRRCHQAPQHWPKSSGQCWLMVRLIFVHYTTVPSFCNEQCITIGQDPSLWQKGNGKGYRKLNVSLILSDICLFLWP